MAKSFVAKSSVALIPVLEVYGFTYSELPTPEVSPAREHPAVWDDYFQRCMADAGFEGLHTIQPGSSYVAASVVLGSNLLERLIRDEIAESGLPGFADPEDDTADPEERISPFVGGFALVVDGESLLEPSCCGDLSNLSSWEEALAERPAEGEIWIGHPLLHVSFVDGSVKLREGCESTLVPDDLVEVTMSVEQFAQAVAAARVELQRFREALAPRVARVVENPEDAPWVADLLAGLG